MSSFKPLIQITKMENFSNTTINIQELPKFEEVEFTALNPKYVKVIFFNLILIIGLLILIPMATYLIKRDIFTGRISFILGFAIPIISGLLIAFSLASFKNRGFAFREHDVLFKSGVLSDTTVIIPYNRVQHVAVHQGFISRKLGLASVEIFTAGGSGSDLEIPGIMKEEAENIKQLIMKKLIESDVELKNNLLDNSNFDNETT